MNFRNTFVSITLLVATLCSDSVQGQTTLSKEYVRVGGRILAVETGTVAADPSNTLNPVSVWPASGGSTTQTFTFVFSKASTQTFGVVNVLINRVLNGVNACYLAYNTASDTLSVQNNAGDLPSTVAVGKTVSGSASNSQCAVSVSGSVGSPWAVFTGNNVSVTINIQGFGPWASSVFNPDKVIYMASRTSGDTASSGWVTMGVWRPSAASQPSIASVSPGNGGGQRRTFAVIYRKTPGSVFGGAQLLINGSIDGTSACYLGYNASGNYLVLQNDMNGANVGNFAFNTAADGVTATSTSSTGLPLSNSQCKLYSVARLPQGDVETFTLDLEFTSSFKTGVAAGRVIGYGGIQDSSGGNSDWAPVFAWSLNY